MTTSLELKPEFVQCLERIADLVLPSRLNVDLWKYARHGGYDKKMAVEDFVQGCKANPLVTELKLFVVYTELQKLYHAGRG